MNIAPTPASPRFEALNALRGIAALLIALAHFPIEFLGSDSPWVRNSFVYTNLFFALSGFVMAAAYADRLTTWSQAWTLISRRLYRLVPLHLATTVLALGVPFLAYAGWVVTSLALQGTMPGAFPGVPYDTRSVLVHTFLLQGFGLLPELVLNFPAWTLGAILVCTLAFAVLSVGAPRLRFWAFLSMCLGSLAGLVHISPHYLGSTVDAGVLRAGVSFFGAAALYTVARKHGWVRPQGRSLLPLQTLALLLLLGYIASVGVNSPSSLWQPLVVAPLLLAFSGDTGDYAKALKHPALTWLSDRAFAILMSQALWLSIGALALYWSRKLHLSSFDTHVLGTAALGLYLLAVLGTAAVLYRHVETRWKPRPAGAARA